MVEIMWVPVAVISWPMCRIPRDKSGAMKAGEAPGWRSNRVNQPSG